jgi:hypothetical protein
VWLLLAAWLAPIPAHAQSQWEQQVNEQLNVAAALFEGEGFSLTGSAITGTLNQQASADHSVTLQGGVGYIVIAVCDNDCSDIDLRLLDEAGNELDSDYEQDAYPIVATTPAGTAQYQVHVYMASCSTQPCFYGVGVYAQGSALRTASVGGGIGERHQGYLDGSDRALESGEYYDLYAFMGTAGQQIILDLHSSEFDPYIMVLGPDGQKYWNDDYEGDRNRALLSLQLTVSGEYQVVVTSYRPGETVAYELKLD